MRRYSSVCKCDFSKSENHSTQLKSEMFDVAQTGTKNPIIIIIFKQKYFIEIWHFFLQTRGLKILK